MAGLGTCSRRNVPSLLPYNKKQTTARSARGILFVYQFLAKTVKAKTLLPVKETDVLKISVHKFRTKR